MMQITVTMFGVVNLVNDVQESGNDHVKSTAELFADYYFQQFTEVRGGGLFGPGQAAAPEPDLEAE